jgi:hypothetical protein
MTIVKPSADHPSSMAERIAKRLRNSGDTANADVTVTQGEGPRRTHTQIHHSASHGRPKGREPEGESE